jgi:2-polyprenyl-6-methoxyphenol hydroxylase-like FAD-dependent oxidoreductase
VRTYEGQRAAVVGGSIGGLTAALLLRRLGFTVDVYERTPTQLDNRGGGIVLQPVTARWFEQCSDRSVTELCTTTRRVRYLGRDDEVLHDDEALWRYSSWGTLYRALLGDFGTERYHLGEHCSGFDQDEHRVELRFTTGRVEHAELVVFADGISSPARRAMFPQVQREYAGYVGWRGTVPEGRLSSGTLGLVGDSLTYGVAPGTHMVLYPIPGPDGSVAEGERLMNYVWYRNVEAGARWQELATDVGGSSARCRSTRAGCSSASSTSCGRPPAGSSRGRWPRSSRRPSSRTCRPSRTCACRRWRTGGSRSSATRPSLPGRTPPPGPRRPPTTRGPCTTTSPAATETSPRRCAPGSRPSSRSGTGSWTASSRWAAGPRRRGPGCRAIPRCASGCTAPGV